jgi:hypothetical protein
MRQAGVLTWLKSYLTKRFPPKHKKQIEEWDFILAFEERYREEIDRYFEKYVGKYGKEGNRYRILNNEK